MARFKRGKTWWTDFTVNGNRYRNSLGTTDWREAKDKEEDLISNAKQGKIAPAAQRLSKLALKQAADIYLSEKRARNAPRTIQTERERLKPLTDYFGATSLNRISADAVRQYVVARKTANLSNRTINMEVACLARILRRAKLWHMIAGEIKPLPELHDIGRVLTPEQKETVLKVASSKPEWQIAYLAMTIALNTTMRACEIRGLLWRDIDFVDNVIIVRKSKTRAGQRIIPMNRNARNSMLTLRARTMAILGTNLLPDWYVFPHAEGGARPDPTKPMSTWRTAWRRMTRTAGLPGLRFHDLRHHAITELAESSTSDQTIMSIAGHVSARMLAHYSHVRLEAKRAALDGLSRIDFEAGYVTIDVTNEGKEGYRQLQRVENMVDVTGIEPATPCLQSRCSPS
jgi:integrase